MSIGPLMLDLESTELTRDEQELLAHSQVGGVILFARNFASAEQTHLLTQSIKSINPNIIIAVDQEGGRVQRFKEEFSILPPMATLGIHYQQSAEEAVNFARDLGELLALEVQSVGCDISFAPVLDLGTETSSVIGDRAFSRSIDEIIILARAFIIGMRAGGMAATGKHFPGHGSVDADSHVSIPYDNRALNDIKTLDLRAFAELADELAAVMPAHIVYSTVDPNPAGFSHFWLQQILRQKLKFDGVIFSDDLSMKGAAVAGDFNQRAAQALAAGCDMVLVCNDRKAAISVLENMETSQRDPQSASRLNRLSMKNAPLGLNALKQTARWQTLSARLALFKQSI